MLYVMYVGSRSLDVGQAIKERFYRPATEAVKQGEGAVGGEGNPAVVAGAGIAAAALAAGAGLTAKKNRGRRAARASSPEE